MKQFLSIDSRKLFYNAYVLPHLDYCWVIVVDHTPSAFLFFQLKWMTFPERAIYQKTIQMYKTLSGTAPNYLKIQYIYTFKNT